MANANRPAPTRLAPREPQRYLAPHLAEAIRTGKEKTGLSWRQLAAVVPVSRSHMNHLANGKRVPSRYVAEALIDALDLDEATAAQLRAVAVPTGRHWDGPERRTVPQEINSIPVEDTASWELGDIEGRHGWAAR